MEFLESYATRHTKRCTGRITPVSHKTLALAVLLVAALLDGCSNSANISTSTASSPQPYMAPTISGGSGGVTSTDATYSISDKDLTFAQKTYAFSGYQSGAQVNYSGNLTSLSRGLLKLDVNYACGTPTLAGCPGVTPPTDPGWAVELANQDGGLLQMPGQPFVPLVPATACPSMSSAETFLFVTLPAPLLTGGTTIKDNWNPGLETAYGSVDISASGSTVTLANIKQYTLPATAGGVAGTPSNPSASSATGACSTTVYGNTVAIPANPTITTGSGGTTAIGPQAMMGIGPSGLLVEDNGTSGSGTTEPYDNALGAGTGAIGMPKPSSAIAASSLVGAQYLGFFYGSGSSGSTTNWSSTVASFGFASLPASCASVATQTSTMLYGGDFKNEDPTTSTDGYGKCDFAIDLGTQDSSTNGLFPAAMVYVGSSFATNTTGKTYSFPAVAIAGQLNGKYAIFLIGEDTTGSPNQAWGIYLLQSN